MSSRPAEVKKFDPSEYRIEDSSTKLKRKTQEDPFVPIGIAGLVAALGWGAISYRRHKKHGMSTSIFLMRLRVAAQGMVVGAITAGVIYSMVKDLRQQYNRDHHK
ncbi:HIG1 domain family member 1C-like [Saccoglossus kowalevskii]|uniref:HIG1 domain family member 1C-like n=1 Tax=Saccoglossus kowalevskii TaxID=10224 RepID=A0ABM0GZ55_SACKO|nr:PREDICTED: HIG1 domain family member 1C-like [Saccoglossus kowalevskii]